jgi:murein L,D-transpeptidase YcbB/YkuD
LSGWVYTVQRDSFAESAREAISREGQTTAARRRNPEETTAALRAIVEAGYLPDLLWPDFTDYRTGLDRFYAPVNYSLAWVRNRKVTPQALALIHVFQNAASQGLLPEDYDAPHWNPRLSTLSRLQPKVNGSDWARFDVALTVSAMRYVSDLYWGRANPGQLQHGIENGRVKFDIAEFLRLQLVATPDVTAALEQLEPPFPAYRSALRALATYSTLARDGDGELLPVPTKTIKPGEMYEEIPRLALLLRRLGDLTTHPTTTAGETVYEGAIVEAVKRFQRRHGLEPDGLIGPRTWSALNTPLSQRVLQLQLALERWRWLPREFARPPIIVNLPEFRLNAYDQQLRPALSMRVVVGRAYKHQTPVFASEMKYLVFRPPWNVPLSIQIEEIVPAVAKEPEYLLKGNYEITDRSGNTVSDGHINELILSELRSGRLFLRQRPGPDNSLGLVKLVIPNDHDVYLHGTPAMSLFSRSRRDFSHGCIRVEDPSALAAWVLQDQPEWTVDSVRAAMNGSRTVPVTLDRAIPAHILYTTAVVMEDGEVRFFEDIYKQDMVLAEAFTRRRSPLE